MEDFISLDLEGNWGVKELEKSKRERERECGNFNIVHPLNHVKWL